MIREHILPNITTALPIVMSISNFRYVFSVQDLTQNKLNLSKATETTWMLSYCHLEICILSDKLTNYIFRFQHNPLEGQDLEIGDGRQKNLLSLSFIFYMDAIV